MARRITGERLDEQGLDYHERLVRLEKTVYGTEHVAGLAQRSFAIQDRVEDLESVDRRRRLPFFLRWFLPATKVAPTLEKARATARRPPSC
jgi:hypothetical protein